MALFPMLQRLNLIPLFLNLNKFFICFLFSFSLQAQEVPRTVIALYDSHFQTRIFYLNLHQVAEMPLNHLGLKLEWHDIQQGLPSLNERNDVIGILTWFPYSATALNPREFIDWSINAIDNGKKYIVMGNPGFNGKDRKTPKSLTNRFWEKLGLIDKDDDVTETYDSVVSELDRELFYFERNYQGFLPSYPIFDILNNQAISHLNVSLKNNPKRSSHLVVTSPNGGFAAENYAIYKPIPDKYDDTIRKWYLNPFKFFSLAFKTDIIPKPDTTTLAGNRIYYSHIDGDGWNNVSELEKYQTGNELSSEVIYKEIFLTYPNLPVTVAPIAADIDLKWFGTEQGRRVAQKIFMLPNIEIGCHTFTHPFDWGFFKNYKPGYEELYFKNYKTPVWKSRDIFKILKDALTASDLKLLDAGSSMNDEAGFKHPPQELDPGYLVPRAYALQPFDLNLEIVKAVEVMQSLAPPGKKVALYQWSGNCQPFLEAILLTEEIKINNINGGDSRFDRIVNSYGWVCPLGLNYGNALQVYASNTNENLYTDMWSKAYFGFNQLPITFERTDSPIRIKPMNVYYHMYSGEKLPSLNAVIQNLEYVRAEECIPIHASNFSAIVKGFYSTKLISLEDRSWAIENRGSLQTIRFDKATFVGVDFSKSKGVIGQRHFQGSLYVYLDEQELTPVITLKDIDTFFEETVEDIPYLISSSWKVWNLKNEKALNFEASGFGNGKMNWKVPREGKYKIRFSSSLRDGSLIQKSKDGHLFFNIETIAIDPTHIEIEALSEQ